jgi:hypothetical protein
MYTTDPFVTSGDRLVHQSHWQVRGIARILGSFEFNVDVIDYDNRSYQGANYDLILEIHPGLTPTADRCAAPAAIRIAYMTGSDHEFSNIAERNRLDRLYSRRGVRLRARRHVAPFPPGLLRSYDGVCAIGNDTAAKTYSPHGLRSVYRIPNTGHPFLRPLANKRKSSAAFVFLASSGQVYKGLDLLLEVFARNPHLTLWVCSSFRRELDFCAAYWRQLFFTKNIKPVGFIDIQSQQFARIATECAYAILPSCAEAMSGSLLTAMSAGIIPVATSQCDLAPGEYVPLPEASPESIEGIVRELSTRSAEWVGNFSSHVTQAIEEHYTAAAFTESIRAALSSTVALRA